ncbi:GNAT family N-acetyltransferase [Paenibacillus mucilaginosus]|uniref:GCN5-like N-acetyltransferase n=3 Tax=Paenibacillus mucilaginosus TaxID=61624 RepID=H6NP66_9BACL|nr:GNAT family N-acetyltransferase [Paenibacillus mucilaginosus]AEI43498.1 GCN5-related N-acetyltransferase [Paenibacillus mucilaginosus KNP414]AFC31140.1 GCN5-like N-acetyltransferase [Paenibacillus mucilaginosus 3016]AFH63462.1 GCN5 family acetyltransferase [Paenibacillus mucilaginosus K02]MCG7211958.1 GNAT family N-acetyltransferase [Paenibacillus mucilaginosus]WDM25050.1 GNAT family N-acetyltransferase [Paenibacillus mucilaginosus]
MSITAELQIRDAHPREREEAVSLSVAAYSEYRESYSGEFWEGYKQSMRDLWFREDLPAGRIIAVRDGRLLGCLLLYPPVERLYERLQANIPYHEIRLLAVDPAARGQGIATALIRECAERARSGGDPYLGLHTTQQMRAAVRLYRRLGFERAPEFDFPGGDERTLVEAYRLPLEGGLSLLSAAL